MATPPTPDARTPLTPPSFFQMPPLWARQLEKVHNDKWTSSPPQVTSYLIYSKPEPTDEHTQRRYRSSPCGFWSYQLDETFRYQVSSSNHRVQELVGRASITLLPHLSSLMPLSDVTVTVKVSFLGNDGKESVQNIVPFTGTSIRSDTEIGTYVEPIHFKGSVQLEITLTFNRANEMLLPTTPSVNAQKALHHSLDGPTFVDTKFYLFSGKVEGRASTPKAVFAKSMLLMGTSNYLREREYIIFRSIYSTGD